MGRSTLPGKLAVVEIWVGQLRPRSGWSSPPPSWDGPSTLVTAFGSSALLDDPQPLRDLSQRYSGSVVVGCSTAGEILGDTLLDGTLTVSVTRFATTRLSLASASVPEPGHSRAAGSRLARDLLAEDPGLKAVFVLSDGLAVNGSELTRGLSEVAERAVITGGLAGDHDRFARTWVLIDGEPRSDVVTAVGLAGEDLRVSFGSEGGWDVLGPERIITRSEGNVLFELDGQPALDLYRSYLGERASGLPATGLLFPLGIREPGGRDRQVVRTIHALDEDARSITFVGDVPQDSLAQLMRGNVERIVDGAGRAAESVSTDEAYGPGLAVVISCVGRRLLLGQRTEDELEAVADALPADMQQIGFYSYGEISPVEVGSCDLHNQTMTITTFQERTGADA